jgi:Acetyltransferase (GNAT) domain
MAEIDAYNPFCTPQFVEARVRQGEQPCLFTLSSQNEMASGCVGFLRGKFLWRNLQIVSLPRMPDSNSFWRGLWQFCLQSGIWHLQVDSYGSPEADIPSLPGGIARRERFEYILDLSSGDFQERLSANHWRNMSRADAAQLTIRCTRDVQGLTAHVLLMGLSRDRRVKRGEQIEFDPETSLLHALLSTGAGQLFQAVQDNLVLSSVLVLRSRTGAYYQSAGTSRRGMEIGASHFLISQVGGILRQEGVRVFNLGGANPENTGLRRFKAGFGSRELQLTAASFCPRPAVQRGLHKTLKALRGKQRDVQQFLNSWGTHRPSC